MKNTRMKAIYVIILLSISLLPFEKDSCTMDSIKASLDHIKYTQILLPVCIILFIILIIGIKLYRKYYLNLKQELYQKDQEIAVIKNKLYKEQETQKLLIEENAEIILSLHKKIIFLTEQKNMPTCTFLHTSILPATEYDKFIHYFQVSNPFLLNYLRAPEFKLTSYEIILCLLAYLDTPASHTECLLDKKYDALKKARQRIKNKMRIGSKDNIGSFLRENKR